MCERKNFPIVDGAAMSISTGASPDFLNTGAETYVFLGGMDLTVTGVALLIANAKSNNWE